jgi:hypothetical protein
MAEMTEACRTGELKLIKIKLINFWRMIIMLTNLQSEVVTLQIIALLQI